MSVAIRSDQRIHFYYFFFYIYYNNIIYYIFFLHLLYLLYFLYIRANRVFHSLGSPLPPVKCKDVYNRGNNFYDNVNVTPLTVTRAVID